MKKMLRKLTGGILAAIMAVSVSAVALPQYNSEAAASSAVTQTVVTGVALDKTAMSLGRGESYRINVTDGGGRKVTWSSSDNSIATVNGGLVTGKKNGKVTITARVSGRGTAKCTVTVKNPPSKVTLTKGVLTLGVGESFTVGSGVNDGAASANRTYRSSNSSIIKMNTTKWTGKFTAVKTGVAYVTVRTFNGKESTCKVTVKVAPSKVSLNRGLMELDVGQSGTLSAIIPSDAGCASRTFRSSNSSVVKMTKTNWTGSFKAVKPGTAYVTVRTYNGKEASCKIVVSNKKVYNAYKTKVNELVKKYGKPMIGDGLYVGVAVVRLIDFDNDGIEELLCAYSEGSEFANKQEIFGYKDGKAVSLYKGDVNRMSQAPVFHLKLIKKNNCYYLLSDAVFKMMDDDWTWIGVKNNKSYLASSYKSFGDTGTETIINTNVVSGKNMLAETVSVMKKLGCSTGGIITESEYERQTGIYERYIKSEDWRKVDLPKDRDFRSSRSGNAIERLYYDFDGDGTLEMWLYTYVSPIEFRPDTLSLICTLKNNSVNVLATVEECPGTIGGGAFTLAYSSKNKKLYIGCNSHSGGFGGSYSAVTGYVLSGSKLKEEVSYSGLTYYRGNESSSYKINGREVSLSEYKSYSGDYSFVWFNNAGRLLFGTNPGDDIAKKMAQLKKVYGNR